MTNNTPLCQYENIQSCYKFAADAPITQNPNNEIFQTYKTMKVSLWRAILANRETQDKKRAAAQQNKAA